MTGSDHWGFEAGDCRSRSKKNRIVPNSRFTTSQKWNSTGIMGNEELRRRE